MKILKRMLLCLLLLSVCLGACGCAAKELGPIGEHTWRFSAVQSRKDGEILYASAQEQEAYGDVYAAAETLELQCAVKGDKITLTGADGKEWSFVFTLKSEAEGVYYYGLEAAESASATLSQTNYSDGSVLHTLLLHFEQYTMYFYDEQ